ncbi:MAG: thioredoxin [Verrucomicrobiota bacterium]
MKQSIFFVFLIAVIAYIYANFSSDATASTPSAGTLTINSPGQYDQAIKDNGVVLVDFWAPWCGPCVKMKPVVAEISNEYEVTVLMVNVDDNPELSSQMNVSSIPLFLVIKDGKVVDRITGSAPKSKLTKYLKKKSDSA